MMFGARDGAPVPFQHNGLCQARIHLGRGKYIGKSLKTSNTEKATWLAEEYWHNTRYELSKGLPLRKRTLNALLDEYIKHREDDIEMGKAGGSGTSIKYTNDGMLRQIKRVQHSGRAYAGKMLIISIDQKTLADCREALWDIDPDNAPSLRAIAAALNDREIEPPRRGRWHATSVARLRKRLADDGVHPGSHAAKIACFDATNCRISRATRCI